MKIRISSLKTLLLIGALLVLSGCATGVPPTSDMKIVRDVQGTWEGEQFEESGLWHVFGDEKTGATAASIRLVFSGNEVVYSTSGAPNPFWSATQKTRGGAGTCRKNYTIENEDEIVFPSFRNDHKMIFRMVGDELVGSRNDLKNLVWKLHRVEKHQLSDVSRAPTQKEIQSFQGRWEGELIGDKGGRAGTLTFDDQRIKFYSDGREYERTYKITESGEVTFLSYTQNDDVIVRASGDVDVLEAYTKKNPDEKWTFHRVPKKEVAATNEKPVREELKPEPTGVSLPASTGLGSSLR